MPVKISEKKLAVAVVLFIAGVIVLLNISLVKQPVLVSEAAVLAGAAGLVLLAFGIVLFKRAVVKG